MKQCHLKGVNNQKFVTSITVMSLDVRMKRETKSKQKRMLVRQSNSTWIIVNLSGKVHHSW